MLVAAAVFWTQVASMGLSEAQALLPNLTFGTILRPVIFDVPCPIPPTPQPPQTKDWVLEYKGREPGGPVKPGTELRILCVGDSITVGYPNDIGPGADGNGYRLELRNSLSRKNSLSLSVYLSLLYTRTHARIQIPYPLFLDTNTMCNT